MGLNLYAQPDRIVCEETDRKRDWVVGTQASCCSNVDVGFLAQQWRQTHAILSKAKLYYLKRTIICQRRCFHYNDEPNGLLYSFSFLPIDVSSVKRRENIIRTVITAVLTGKEHYLSQPLTAIVICFSCIHRTSVRVGYMGSCSK